MVNAYRETVQIGHSFSREENTEMFSADRRLFLHQTAKAGVAWGVSSLFGGAFRGAQTSAPNTDDTVRVYLDSRRVIAPLDRNLFGSFLEHLGRAIYEGVYDPGSKLSEANGFRKDVISEIREMGVPIVRYPGGNFVSGYNWLDGVGPKESRPRVLDKAWNAINTNQFGTNEFMAWCKAVGTEPLMGLNLGTGTPEAAAALVEYCNLDQGTEWSDLRRKHGVAQPYKVKRWCLGNEMDGPWQIGHMTATEYGMKAQDAARQMRYVDPSLQLIACGSSGPFMPTYLEWDREVLEQCYDYVDGLSLHRYFTNAPADTGGDSSKFLAMNLSMEQQISETLAVCDLVRGHKRSPKQLWLSFDEWNVWYRARDGEAVHGHHQEAPHLLEEVYNLEDALLVGSPTYEVAKMGHVPYIDVAGTLNPQDGKVGLFVLNRDLTKAHVVEINWQDKAPGQLITSSVLTGTDLKAFNTFDAPQKVTPQTFAKPSTSAGRTKFEVSARSYTVIQWSA